MAGRIRQPIDQEAFSKFVAENVPEIQIPIDLKQVSNAWISFQQQQRQLTYALA